MGAAFAFISEIFSQKSEKEQDPQMSEILRRRLSECMEKHEAGRLKMTITLPDEAVLDHMAKSLAQILGQGWKQ